MKVKELIKILRRGNPEAKIVIRPQTKKNEMAENLDTLDVTDFEWWLSDYSYSSDGIAAKDCGVLVILEPDPF